METIVLLVLSLLCSSMAQRTKEDTNGAKELSLPDIVSRFVSNSSDNTVYFHAIPASLYYNDTSEAPIPDINHMFNLTGLSSEDVKVVLAFPYPFPRYNTSEVEPVIDVNTTDNSIEPNLDLETIPTISPIEHKNEFKARILAIRSAQPPNGFNIFNPMTWFPTKAPTTVAPAVAPTTAAPPVINNFFAPQPQPQMRPLQIQFPPIQPIQLPVVNTQLVQSAPQVSASIGNVSNPPLIVPLNLGQVPQTSLATAEARLRNVQLSGLTLSYPSYPLVASGRIVTDTLPKPEYPNSRPSIMELVYN